MRLVAEGCRGVSISARYVPEGFRDVLGYIIGRDVLWGTEVCMCVGTLM